MADVELDPLSIEGRIAARLAARERKVWNSEHPGEAGWKIVYRLPVNREELDPIYAAAARAAKQKVKFHFDATLLAKFGEEIWYQGDRWDDPDTGRALTFSDERVRKILGKAESASEAVRNLYDSDGFVTQIAASLLDRAGYSDEIDTEDAEDPSSAG